VIIINKGIIAADGNMEDLTKRITGDNRLIARIEGDKDEILKVIRGIKNVISVTADMDRETNAYDYEIEIKENEDIRRELVKRISARNWNILGLRSDELTLEDIFLKITLGDENVLDSLKPQNNLSDEKKTDALASASAAVAAATVLNRLKADENGTVTYTVPDENVNENSDEAKTLKEDTTESEGNE
jgi:ABC-2 type transport system ATP-binding protein